MNKGEISYFLNVVRVLNDFTLVNTGIIVFLEVFGVIGGLAGNFEIGDLFLLSRTEGVASLVIEDEFTRFVFRGILDEDFLVSFVVGFDSVLFSFSCFGVFDLGLQTSFGLLFNRNSHISSIVVKFI